MSGKLLNINLKSEAWIREHLFEASGRYESADPQRQAWIRDEYASRLKEVFIEQQAKEWTEQGGRYKKKSMKSIRAMARKVYLAHA